MNHIRTLAVSVLLLGATAAQGNATSEQYAKRLYQRVTGIPIGPQDPRLTEMVDHIASRDFRRAAEVAVEVEEFYAVTLRNISAPMSARNESPMTVFNDFQATFIGAVRDNLDARTLLTGNYRYEGYDDLGLPLATLDSNVHYAEIEQRGLGLKRNLQKVSPQWRGFPVHAGLLTSRTWAHQHLNAGTNRRAVEFTFKQFLCKEMPQIRDRALPVGMIRRDVDRTPGGDASKFHDDCRGCHGIIDSFGGAFARLDFQDQELVYSGEFRVWDKMNINSHVYPEGHPVRDDRWINFANRNGNVALGWRGSARGRGVLEFGELMASSVAFSQCMVKRAYKGLCGQDLADGSELERLASEFEADNYQLKSMIVNVVTQDSCVTHPAL